MTVLVFGSLNFDLVTRSPRLPLPGETLTGHSFTTVPGGKGANQAVAVARLGIATRLIGRVGGDGFGQELLMSLRTVGVNCEDVTVDETVNSGVATIAIDDAGENHIIITPGANGRVNQVEIDRLQMQLPNAIALLLQLEIPLESVLAAAQAAKRAGVTVILDPAPAVSNLPEALYRSIDILTPNQTEASQLVGMPVTDRESALQAAIALQAQGVASVIIKLGSQGAVCATPDGNFTVPAFPVTVVDTVAAGDAFNGGLAAGLALGLALPEACRWGAAAGAIAVTRAGAQSAMPTRAELENLLHLVSQADG